VPLLDRRSRAFVALAVLFTILGLASMPAFAQEEEERLEELKAEREKVQEERAAKALQVNAAEADFDELIEALDAINALVDLQEARLADAQQAVLSAEEQVDAAKARNEEITIEIEGLQEIVGDLAVAAFTGEGGANGEDLTSFLLNDDPTEAARRRSLVEFQTGNLSDTLDRMRALVTEAELVEAQRVRAVESALANRIEVEARRAELDDAVDAQVEIVIAAETRLEARLAEAAFIGELDEELAAEIRTQEEAIARRIREEAARKAAAEAAARRANLQPPAGEDDLVNAEGFLVHRDVGDNVTRMIQAAAADGVNLSGYGWRSPQRTAELRVINGCPDVYDSPPSSCRIPTARPGQSMHERGLAIDFSSCWRGSPCFVWLSNNAATYGFRNLPSESWHWSTNGS
jgi:hypothetical protein